MTAENAVPADLLEPELITAEEGGSRVDSGALLIDVRSEATRGRVGAIDGATVVDRERLAELFDEGSPERIDGSSKDRPVVVVCATINGSRPVAEWLRANGFDDVSHVDGGFDAWKLSGRPTTPGSETTE